MFSSRSKREATYFAALEEQTRRGIENGQLEHVIWAKLASKPYTTGAVGLWSVFESIREVVADGRYTADDIMGYFGVIEQED